MKKHTINFTLNSEKWSLEVEASDTLLEMLREKTGIKSPKVACQRGDCGACTVLLNGKSVRSCLILAVEIDGHEIITIEGLAQKEPSPLQKIFAKKNAFQCGFCAPGIVISTTELLEKNPTPSKEEIKESISGNLCRCTGYQSIIDSIHEFATESNQSKNNN